MEKSELYRLASDMDIMKKLMVLSLIQKGFKQKQLASVMGISEGTLSAMFPKGLLKDAKGLSSDE